MSNVNILRVICLILFALLLFGVLSFASYLVSKRNAEKFVGKTLEDYQLESAILALAPFDRKDITWRLSFSDLDPNSYDNGFIIYTTILGQLVITNPSDLGERLSNLEMTGIQPDSLRARKEFRQKQIIKEQAIHEKGVDLFESSLFKKAFSEHFNISNIEAQEVLKSKVHFNGPEWRATLTPKKNYPFPCKILAVFPIKNKNTVEASITPEEIENVLDKSLSHPYIIEHIANTVITGIRLQITGDRLHWDTSELQNQLVELKGDKAEENLVRNWARLYIDGQYHNYKSIYYNRITGELIYKENETICSPPILIPSERHINKQFKTIKST